MSFLAQGSSAPSSSGFPEQLAPGQGVVMVSETGHLLWDEPVKHMGYKRESDCPTVTSCVRAYQPNPAGSLSCCCLAKQRVSGRVASTLLPRTMPVRGLFFFPFLWLGEMTVN